MIPSLRVTAFAAAIALILAACGQKGPLVMPKDEFPKASPKAQAKTKAKATPTPTPQASPESEEPSPDVDEVQDGYAPVSDQPEF